MEKAIQVEGLQKSYKQLHVLKGVDFEVKKGSIFALQLYCSINLEKYDKRVLQLIEH